MAHRDLKLENIIVTSKVLLETVILDFGFAERINSQRLISKAGTPGYIAPEVFDGKPYTEKGDVFSLGVMYYSMVSGKSPFRGRDYREIMESNRQAQLSFSSFQGISEECQVLICQMMERDPAKRISFLDILSNEVPRSHQ
jgi:serine/threonine protein kinase